MHFAGDRRTLCVRKRKPKIYHETESLFLLSGQFLKLHWSLLSWIQKLSFNNPLAKANQQTNKKFLVCKKRTACLVLARKNYCMLKRKISAKPLWSYDFFFYINKRKPRYTWVLASFLKWKFGSQEYKVYYVWRESIKKKIYWFVVSKQK